MFELHASAAPRFILCPRSGIHKPAGGTINTTSPEAQVGRAVHQGCHQIINPPTYPPLEPLELAAAHGLDDSYTTDISVLLHYARKSWDEKLSAYFPYPRSEHKLSANFTKANTIQGRLTGTPDIYDDTFPDESRVLDWKTSRIPNLTSYTDQMKSYCLLLAMKEPKPKYMAVIVWLREQRADVTEYTHGEIMLFRDQLIDQYVKYSDQVNPGEHCTYCPVQYDCDAQTMMVHSAIESVVGISYDNLNTLEPIMDATWEKIKMVQKTLDDLKTAISDYVLKNGELRWDTDEGQKVLGIKERITKKLDLVKAVPELQRYMSNEEIIECCTASIPALGNIVAQKAPRGKKTLDKTMFIESLKAKGLIETKTSQFVQLWEVKTEKGDSE